MRRRYSGIAHSLTRESAFARTDRGELAKDRLEGGLETAQVAQAKTEAVRHGRGRWQWLVVVERRRRSPPGAHVRSAVPAGGYPADLRAAQKPQLISLRRAARASSRWRSTRASLALSCETSDLSGAQAFATA